jgi:hypothetical protein
MILRCFSEEKVGFLIKYSISFFLYNFIQQMAMCLFNTLFLFRLFLSIEYCAEIGVCAMKRRK